MAWRRHWICEFTHFAHVSLQSLSALRSEVTSLFGFCRVLGHPSEDGLRAKPAVDKKKQAMRLKKRKQREDRRRQEAEEILQVSVTPARVSHLSLAACSPLAYEQFRPSKCWLRDLPAGSCNF